MTHFQNLTVYLGSSGRARPVFKDSAIALGTEIGAQKRHLIYGGMDAGLMGIVANAALDAGAQVTGIIPQKLKDSERIHTGLNETILVDDLWERKAEMFAAADAIIALPGGYGTLDESLEVLYWANLKLHNRILALVNIEGYWNHLIAHIKSMPDFEADYLVIADDIDDLFVKLDAWEMPSALQNIETAEGFPHFEGEILAPTDAPIIFNKASIASSYHMVSALGLKQLDKHSRAIGVLNDEGQFDHLLRWIDVASTEHFITDHCKGMFSVAHTLPILHEMLERHTHTVIDLHAEKWGK